MVHAVEEIARIRIERHGAVVQHQQVVDAHRPGHRRRVARNRAVLDRRVRDHRQAAFVAGLVSGDRTPRGTTPLLLQKLTER